MFSLKDFRFVLVFVTICSISNADEQQSDQHVVIEEESGDDTCSYILTVPKSQCSCNCEDEFRKLIDDYESRLREVENLVLELFDHFQEESSNGPSSSFQLFHSLDSSVDLSPTVTDSTPTTPIGKLTSASTSTQEPANELTTPQLDLSEEHAQEGEEIKVTTKSPVTHEPANEPANDPASELTTQRIILTEESQEDEEVLVTTKSHITSEKPIVVQVEDEQNENPFVYIRMTAEVEEIPLPVNDEGTVEDDGMSGYVLLPDSSEEKSNLNDARSHPLPPIEAFQQFDEILEEILSNPPAPNPFPSVGIELNLAAHKSDSDELEEVITDHERFNDAQEAFNSPQQLLRPIQPSVTEEDEGKANPPEDKRPPPGFVEGMETANGYTGDVNRPQWKKLETFLEAPKTNITTKRERPSGMERVPSCRRDGCACLITRAKTHSGIYYLPNVPQSGKRGNLVEMYCDLETEDGGWTVIQRRQNGSANFYRNWNHYAHGFGYLDDSFWIGNRMLHAMTRRFNYEIRIEFMDWRGKTGFAEYNRFYVGPEDDNFRLNLGKFTAGNRGNAFSYHNGTMFSTLDRDNDKSPGECAVLRQAGFWFKNCNRMNPNGRWIPFPDGTGLNGAIVTWGTWTRHLYTYSLKEFRMMIRPTSRSDYA